MPFLSWYKNIFSLKFSSCLFEEVLHFVYNNRDRFFFSFLFFIDFIELHIFLCSPPLLSPSFQPSSKVPMLLIYSGDHVFWLFLKWLSLWILVRARVSSNPLTQGGTGLTFLDPGRGSMFLEWALKALPLPVHFLLPDCSWKGKFSASFCHHACCLLLLPCHYEP